MKHAVLAGRDAYLAGRMPKRFAASPSSPVDGKITGDVTGNVTGDVTGNVTA